MLTETAKQALEYFCRDWNNLNATGSDSGPEKSSACFPEKTSDSTVQERQKGFPFLPERTNTQNAAPLAVQAPPLASPASSNAQAATLTAPACSTGEAATTHPAAQQTGAMLSVVKSEYPSQISSARQAVLSLQQRYRAEVEMAQATGTAGRRVDLEVAAKLEHLQLNRGQVHIGLVPGVEVGDTFCSRAELRMVGLHRLLQAGIDVQFCEQLNKPIAVAIAMKEDTKTTGYGDNIDMGDTVIYSGQGGVTHRPIEERHNKDQDLVAGNRALVNSHELHTPVRLIRGYVRKEDRPLKILYSYDGLYFVTEVRYKEGAAGNKVFMFVMQRMKGQPPLKLYKQVSDPHRQVNNPRNSGASGLACTTIKPAPSKSVLNQPLTSASTSGITSASHAEETSVPVPLAWSSTPGAPPAKRRLLIPSFLEVEQQLTSRRFEPSMISPSQSAVGQVHTS